jgi:hypothetical protein
LEFRCLLPTDDRHRPAPPRWVLLGAIGLAVAVLHVLVLFVLGPAWFDIESPAPAIVQPMQVRSVALAPREAMSPLPPGPSGERQAPAPARAAPRQMPAPFAVADEPAAASAPAAETPTMLAAAPIEVPLYATRLAPAGQWRYRITRGVATGEAQLRWPLSDDAHYELQLEGQIAGVTLLDWGSRGQLDAAGIATERFALRRRGRDQQAANFQRDAGKITFSGPTHEPPLPPGVQDRLCWMLQLPAIVARRPNAS